MSNDAELSISELRKKRAEASSRPANVAQEQGSTALEPIVVEPQPRQVHTYVEVPRGVNSSGAGGGAGDDEEKVELPFDPWRLPEAIKKRWYWLVLVGFVFGLMGGALGYWRTKY